jgi:replicative DNA helicase
VTVCAPLDESTAALDLVRALVDRPAGLVEADAALSWRWAGDLQPYVDAARLLWSQDLQSGKLELLSALQEVGGLDRIGGPEAAARFWAESLGAAARRSGAIDRLRAARALAAWRSVVRSVGPALESATGSADAQAALLRASRELAEAAAASGRADAARTLEDALHAEGGLLERIRAPEVPADHRLQTGLRALDWYLAGGFDAGALVTIGAESSHGKTALAVQLVVNATRLDPSARCLVFSLEMTAEELAVRAARQAGLEVPDGAAQYGAAHHQADLEPELLDFGRETGRRVVVDDSPRPSVDYVQARAHQVARQDPSRPLRLVVVDYVQILDRPGRSRPDLEFAHISRTLKVLARELGVTVIQLSQLRRRDDRAHPRPTLERLKESSALENDSDVVALLWRPERLPQYQDRQDLHGLAELNLAKVRNGRTGRAVLRFDGPNTRFTNRLETDPDQLEVD